MAHGRSPIQELIDEVREVPANGSLDHRMIREVDLARAAGQDDFLPTVSGRRWKLGFRLCVD